MPSEPTLRQAARDAASIAAELRREFETAFQQLYGRQPERDPVLATMFHALAVQIGRVYDEAEHVFPVAVLDDLIAGLGMPLRLARPSQAVVQFSNIEQREWLTPETELSGFTRAGEQLVFSPDVPFQVAPVRLAFAALFDSGRLQTIPGGRLPSGIAIPPSSTPLPERWAPTLFLAFDVDDAHLGNVGVHIDVVPIDGPTATALRDSPWQLLNRDGVVSERGLLRARAGAGGVRLLDWLTTDELEPPSAPLMDSELPFLGAGPFGPQTWVFPHVPAARRFRGAVPGAIATAATRLLPPDGARALDRPLVWIQIPLPAGSEGAAGAIQSVAVNAVTASNVEVTSEHVYFDRIGSVVALRPEGAANRHVLGLLSVTGESGARYASESDVGEAVSVGRYRYRGGIVRFRPSRGPTGRFDSFAVLRTLFCDGKRANGLDVGDIRRIGASLANVTAQVRNVTASRGGDDPPAYDDARLRFAEQLRSRERVVTAADIEIAARAYEPRIRTVDTSAISEISDGALRPVEMVSIGASPGDFADPQADFARLGDGLQRHLQDRSMIGHTVRVAVRAHA